MDRTTIMEMLQKIAAGKISPEEGLKSLRDFPYKDLGNVKLDYHRNLRKPAGEVIFCQNKTEEDILQIAKDILASGQKKVMFSRVSDDVAKKLLKIDKDLFHNKKAKMVYKSDGVLAKESGIVGVVTAGTADIPVAEEAAVTATVMGTQVERFFDVGVAGIHRLFSVYDDLQRCGALVVVAGMEGALPSIIAGLVSCPVIAVPTSVGYGANFGGISALLTMLNSCAPGISVVNIDNGFGAGYSASLIVNPIDF